MKTFTEYLVEKEGKTAIITWGRMNPPTIGHEKLLNKMSKLKGDHFVYLTHTQDNKKNPLSFDEKIKYAKLIFPKYKDWFVVHNFKVIFDVIVDLYAKGYTDIKLVVGSDRINQFKAMIEKYNGVEAKHGYFKFNSIEIVSSGERDMDSDKINDSTISASKLREFAINDDYQSFIKGLPKVNDSIKMDLFKLLQQKLK